MRQPGASFELVAVAELLGQVLGQIADAPVTVRVWPRWGSSSRHRPGQVLADLAPRAKVVQTVVCSTFTRGAKPATRRVADGERMNPRGRVARPRRYRGDVEHQGDQES